MEEGIRPRLIPLAPGAEERRTLRGFGIGFGLMLLLIAWRVRAHRDAAAVLTAAGAACLLAAPVRPALFGPLFRAWMPAARVLARVNLWLVCAILYYFVVTPYGLLLRALGLSPLELKLREKDSYWDVKPPRDPATSARRMF